MAILTFPFFALLDIQNALTPLIRDLWAGPIRHAGPLISIE